MSGQAGTETFFDKLAERAREPLLRRTDGTVRFDLTHDGRTEHWYVTLRHGDIAVSRSTDPADAVVRVDKQTFKQMAAGEVNAMAAVLRGEMVVEGDLGLVMLFQRVFPSPSSSQPPRHPSAAAAAAPSTKGGR